MRLKEVIRVGPQSHGTGILRRGGGNDTGHISFLYHVCTEERPYEDTLGRPPHASQEEPSPETRPADTLTLDFQPPQPRGNKCLPFKSPRLCYSGWQPQHTHTVHKKVLSKNWIANQIILLLKLLISYDKLCMSINSQPKT